MKQPFPVIAHVTRAEIGVSDWDASNIDWSNTENMIVIHPFPNKRMDLPVYPKGFTTVNFSISDWRTEQLATRKESSLNRYSSGTWTTCIMML